MPLLLPNGATIAEPGDQPGDLIDRPRQIEFNGLLLGSNTPYRWKELTGWDDQPSLDLADTPRPSDHGDYPGLGLFQSRLPALTMVVEAADPWVVEELLGLLVARAAYSDTELPLIVRDTSRKLVAGARVQMRTIPHQPQRTLGIATAAVQWKCSDTRRYASGFRSVHLTPGVASGGLVYPLEYPLNYGTPATGATAVLGNDGTTPAPAVVRFRGPGTGHAVKIGDLLLKVNLPLGAGDTLTVDTRTGSVLLNNSSDRTDWVTRDSVPPEAWLIPVGSTPVRFTVTSGSGPETAVDIEWSDAYQ